MVRVERLFALVAAREIAFQSDTGAILLRAEERIQGGMDLHQQVVFDRLAVIEHSRGSTGIGIQRAAWFAEQVPVHVEHGDRIGLQTFDGAGGQVLDSRDVLLSQFRAGPQPDQDAGLGGLAQICENRILAEGNVDPCAFHAGEGHHRAFELALNRPAQPNLLVEFGGAEVLLIEELKSETAAARQTSGRHIETKFRDARRRDQDGAVLSDFVVDVGNPEFLDDGCRILGGQAGEHRAQVAILVPANPEEDAAGDQTGCDRNQQLLLQ